MQIRLGKLAVASLLASRLVGSPLAARATPATAAEEAVDISADKPKMVVLSDGKKHYIAIVPFAEDSFAGFFYGDGKSFWQQRIHGGGSVGKESFDKIFWDPRAHAPYEAALDFKDGKYVVTCSSRKTELTPVAEGEAKSILDGARFYKPHWKRQAYALSRDNTGRYFYVDKAREPEGNKSFRLFVGMKGALKLQKMTNVVSDSAGDIFATKTGELRLILNAGETLWQQAGKQTKLIHLPVEDNHVLIYSELGVYTGERLGTPCDDL
jgi:hypothetical protein